MSTTSRIVAASLSVAASGAVTLVPITRMSTRVQWGIGAALTLVPAVGTAVVARRALRRRSDARRAAIAVGAVVGVSATSLALWDASLRLDRALEHGLARRGVRRPRVAMAVGSAALTAAMEVVEVVRDRRAAA